MQESSKDRKMVANARIRKERLIPNLAGIDNS